MARSFHATMRLGVAHACLSGALLAMPAYAQTATDRDVAPQQAPETQTSDIIVTAQKREERLLDVPIAISVASGAEIASRNVTSLQEMQFAVPGLSTVRLAPGSTEYTQIRGVGSSSGTLTVGFYLDEMPVTGDAQGSTLDIRLLDMQRLEVLRGPQATLYGENSMGGTIRYVTAPAVLDRFEGNFEAEAGSVRSGDGNYRANGVVNIPIVSDTLALRVVGGYERIGGWIDKPALGEKDVNGASIYTVRGRLDANLGEDGHLSVLALHQESYQRNLSFGIDQTSSAPIDQPNRDNYEIYQGTFNYGLGFADFVLTAGYIDRKNSSTTDFSGFYVPILQAALGLPPGFISAVGAPGFTNLKSFNSEARLSSPGNEAFHWTVGGYLRHIRGEQGADLFTQPNALPFVLTSADNKSRSNAWSVFGEASYRVADVLTVLGGLRYYHDHRGFNSISTTFGTTATNVGDANFHTVNPRVNISYTPTRNTNLYVNAAKGFRSGGFNTTSSGPGISPTYRPDSIWTYEGGAKQQLFGRRVNLEAAVFYSDWKDVQSSFLVPGTVILTTNNGGAVRGWGAEFAATVIPVTGLSLSGTYGFNDLKNKVATADKNVGDPADFSARETWSASASYRAALGNALHGFARFDYQHLGRQQVTLRSFGQIARFPIRNLVNARFGVEFAKFEVGLFATNLFDSRTPITPVPYGAFSENTEMQPRVIGVSFRARY